MKRGTILLLLLISFFCLNAQHAYYSSLNQNLLSLNPAFAGTAKQLRSQVIYGNTGPARYSYNKQSMYAGVDVWGKKYSGFGLSFSNDNYGPVLRRTQVDLSYAFHFKIGNRLKIAAAVQASYFEYKFDRTKLGFGYYSYPNPSDAFRDAFTAGWNQIIPSTYKRNADFSAGLLIYGSRYYFGASVLSVTQPDEGMLGVSKRPLTQIYQGKYRLAGLEFFSADVYALAKIQKIKGWYNCDNFMQYGTYLNYQALSLHLAHRINDIVYYDSFITGIALNFKGFKMGYNNRCNYASHVSNFFFNELYVQYNFGKNKKDADGKTVAGFMD